MVISFYFLAEFHGKLQENKMASQTIEEQVRIISEVITTALYIYFVQTTSEGMEQQLLHEARRHRYVFYHSNH